MADIILTTRHMPEREPIVTVGRVTYETAYEYVGSRGIWPFRVHAYRMVISAFVDEAVESCDFVETVLMDSAALPSGVSYLRYRNALHAL